MNETRNAGTSVNPLRVRAVHKGASTDITADEIWITLSNGIEFVLRNDAYGSLGAHIPCTPDNDEFAVFVVRPGASNVLVLNAERHACKSQRDSGG
ncbi:hypothetical protein OIU81_08430 [Streptomyces sp. NBC_01454]|uniref:hypothetical protein n=1 Tax=Streptomyces sp. NBC_01454 TaxID=2975867 RepID=UPI002E378C4B|nr:hypothetical protein [Streptomyces sp. NBC_01454]